MTVDEILKKVQGSKWRCEILLNHPQFRCSVCGNFQDKVSENCPCCGTVMYENPEKEEQKHESDETVAI